MALLCTMYKYMKHTIHPNIFTDLSRGQKQFYKVVAPILMCVKKIPIGLMVARLMWIE
jgi:hypothetical protein